ACRPEARGRADRGARGECRQRRRDAGRVRLYGGPHGSRARDRGGDGCPQSEAPGSDLRRTRDGRANRQSARPARGPPDLALRTRARAIRGARACTGTPARACGGAARGGGRHGTVSVDQCLGNLDEAIAAGQALGLDASAAIATRETARARLGFPSSAYVLALVGGTGVGKSTLLNAIAGENVSPAGARRPTTSDAVAWVSSSRGRELAGLLQWLGISELREH